MNSCLAVGVCLINTQKTQHYISLEITSISHKLVSPFHVHFRIDTTSCMLAQFVKLHFKIVINLEMLNPFIFGI